MAIRQSLVLSLGILLPTTALATSDDESTALTNEMTVLRKHPEPVQWAPESITVLSAETLDVTNLYALEDLEGLVPGLLIDSLGGTPRGAAISMRGVGSAEVSSGFFPAVALYVDGVYSGTHGSQNPLLFDLDTIEVHRGPEGVFSGAPALAGSINLQRKKPSGQWDSKTRVSFGDFSRRRLETTLDFPLPLGIAGKAALNYARRGAGVFNNTFSGRKENEDHRTAAYLSLLWEGESGTSIQYTFDDSRDKSDVPALLNLSSLDDLQCASSVGGANCSVDGAGLRPTNDAYTETAQNFSNRRLYDVAQHALHASFSYLGVDFKSITALRSTEELSAQDLDATSADFYSSTRDQDYDQFTQEFTALGQISEATSYRAGLFLLTNKYTLARSDEFVLDQLASAAIIPTPGTRQIESEQRNRIVSIFGHAEHVINEQWKSDFGMRFNFVRNEFDHGVTAPNPSSPVVVRDHHEYNQVSTSVGFTYKVDDNAMVYMRYSQGFRPGVYDDSANSAEAAAPILEENTTNLELGLKSEWFADRLRVNFTTFQNTLRDKVERYPALLASGNVESILGNASETELRGHELEIESVPFDNLVLRATLSHLNANYVYYRIPNIADPFTPLDKEGLSVPLASPGLYHFSGAYSFPFDQGDVTLYAAYRHVKEYTSNPEVAAGRVSNSTMLDLAVTYRFSDWQFRLFSHNLNDNRYLTNVSRVFDAEFAPLPGTTTTSQGLLTSAEISAPRFTGFEIVYSRGFPR